MNLGGAELEHWFAAVGLGAARTIPIVYLVPAFGGPNLPAFARLGLGLALALLCLPKTLLFAAPSAGLPFWLLLFAREALVGATVGLVAGAFFRAVEAAGRLADILRGANMAEVIAPLTEGRTSPLGDVSLLLAVVIFLELGGLGHMALALGRSYDAVPLGLSGSTAALQGSARLVIWSSARLLISAVSLAAPVIVALLLADVVLGAVARLAPQIPIYFVGMPLKALAGVGIVLVSLGAVAAAVERELGPWQAVVDRAFGVWK